MKKMTRTRQINLLILTLLTSFTLHGQIGPVTGLLSGCAGYTSALSDTTPSGTWTSSNTTIATIGSASGIVTGISTGAVTITYTVGAGFVTTTFTVNPAPALFTVTGGGSYCAGGTGVTVGLNGSQAGISYTLFNGAASISTIAGTGSPISFGAMTAPGTYTVAAEYGTSCATTMSGSAPVSINPLPTSYSVTGGGNYCLGGAGMHVGLSNSQSGINYQLYNGAAAIGSAITGIGSSLDFGLQTATGSYTVIAINSATGCTGSMAGSASIGINTLPTSYTVTGGGTICSGSAGAPVGLSNSATGISYQLYSGGTAVGSPVAGTGTSLSFGLQSSSGTYTIIGTNTTTTCTSNMTGSATVSVNPSPAAISGAASLCSGTATTFSNATIGGTWSSSSTATLTIGSSSGTATAVATGTTLISYTLPTGCNATAAITINGTPSPVSGTPSLCVGTIATFSDATSGGYWSSSSPALSIGSATGIVTGVSAGMASVSYTVMLTGCSASMTVTVNASPAPISGTTSLCSGVPAAFSGSVSGGTWISSSPSIATINPSTGVATGNIAGVDVISYTLSTGCSASVTITVNVLPAAISGSSTLCEYTTAFLSESTPGGTWSSSNTGIVSVGSAGAVTGNTTGTATISYTMPSGCATAMPVAVILGACVPSGSTSICAGSTASFSDCTPGGLWYSSNTAVATIGSASGVISGIATGASTITYSLSSGCQATKTITINSAPIAISGPPSTCVGSTATYTDITAGGSWSASNPAVGTIGAASGIVTGISAGNMTITYTLPGGCYATYTLTVIPSPCPGSGIPSLCVGSSQTISTYCLPAGGAWSSSFAGIATIGSSSGVATGVTAGVTTVTYTIPGGGCRFTLPMSVNPVPAPISGVSAICSGGATAPLSDATPGGTWSSSNLPVATVGTSGIVTGLSAGTTSISYTASGCSVSKTITINATPSLHTITGGGGYCSGSFGADVRLNGSDAGISYQLYNGSTISGTPLTGTGSPLDFGYQTASGIYTIKATTAGTSCTATMTGSTTISILPSPTAFSVTGGGGYCPGDSGVHVELSGSQTGVSYQLMHSGSPVGGPVAGTGAALDFGVQSAIGTYAVVATNTANGCVSNMSGGTTVSVFTLPTVFTVSGGGSYCSGSSGVHIFLSGSQAGTSYALYNGTSLAGTYTGSGYALDLGLFTATGSYTVVATSTATGCSSNMAGSVYISATPLPTAYAVTGGGSYCAGSAGVHIGLNGSASGIIYQLYNGTTPIGAATPGTGTSIDFGLQTTAGIYTVVATNPVSGCTNTMAGSATVVILPVVTPSLTISSLTADTICAGTSDIFTLHPVNGGASPVFTWSVNGTPIGITGISYSYVPANGDVIMASMLSSATCASPSAVSASLTMTVRPHPVIYGAASLCMGSTITLSSSVGSTWSSSTPAVATISTVGATTGVIIPITPGTTVITCDLAGCTSATVVTVNPLPSVTVSSSKSCGGTSTLTAGGAISYTWSPSIGLTCATCTVTDANPGTTMIYTVTGTDTIGCTDTASILVDGNRISGYISYGVSPHDTFKVWLIQFNPADTSIISEDSTLSCLSGGAPYYEFDDKPAGKYMVFAKMLGQTTGDPGFYFPTYGLQAATWDAASAISHLSATDTMHINMIYGSVPAGPGYIGGYISRGTSGGGFTPAAKVLVLLKDAFGTPLSFTYTDAFGNYSFSNIAIGDYIVYPEDFNYHTTPSATVSLTGSADSAKHIDFRIYTPEKVITPVTIAGIHDVDKNAQITVFPNPSSGIINIQWNESITENATVQINDVLGREIYNSRLNMSTPQGTIRIESGNIRSGIYLLSIKSENMDYSKKIIITN